MIRHVVMHRVKATATEEAVAAWKAAVVELGTSSPEVKWFSFGSNVGSGPNHFDTATIMDFEDIETFRAYIKSDKHMTYVQAHAKPVIDQIAAVQHEL